MTAGGTRPGPLRDRYPHEPGVRLAVLSNGLRVLTRSRTHTRAVAMNLAVLAGSRDEDASTAGAAHLMEHLFFQGTPSRPSSDDVIGPILARGGVFNAATERETIGFFIEIPASATAVAFDALGDVITHAEFDPAALERVRGIVVAELTRRANDPARLLIDTLNDLLLRGHPAAHSPGGTVENVRTTTREALIGYRERQFRAGNMVLAVVGRADHAAVAEAAEQALGFIPAGHSIDRRPAELPATRLERREISGGRTTAHLAMGFVAPGLESAERYALAVTAAILGRVGRRLSRELREGRALTYAASAHYGALTDVGIFTVSTSADPERVDEAIEVIGAELRRLQIERAAPAELEAAQGYIEGRTFLSEERNLAQAHRLSSQELLGVPQSLPEYVRQIKRVTLLDVQHAARRFLDPDRSTIVVVRP